MKTEFDLNNLTDKDVEVIEEALSRRRRILKMGYNEFDKHYTQRGLSAAMSVGFRPHEICAIVAPNYENIDRSIFTQSRQLRPFYEYLEDLDFVENQISEEHEQYNAIFNQFRRSKYLPSIELKIGNLYEIKLVDNIKYLYLIRIEGNINLTPELYFSMHNQNKTGMNISVYKILKEIK